MLVRELKSNWIILASAWHIWDCSHLPFFSIVNITIGGVVGELTLTR